MANGQKKCDGGHKKSSFPKHLRIEIDYFVASTVTMRSLASMS
jgi:hypothetical protein